MRNTSLFLGLVAAAVGGCTSGKPDVKTGAAASAEQQKGQIVQAAEAPAATQPSAVAPEIVATFDAGPMPTGVAVSHTGRVFVNFPRWGDPVDFSVAEIVNGKAVAYPGADINRFDPGKASDNFLVVQSVFVDPKDRLWVLDAAAPNLGPNLPGGPKLVCIDLGTNRIVQKILFPPDVAPKTTYLNDVRFDLNRGQAGFAYISDSASDGPNAIIVVDLASGRSWRKLNDHPSVKAEPNFVPIVEGQPLMQREPLKPAKPLTLGSDGIAVSNDGKTVYYSALMGHHLYSVPTDVLADENSTAQAVSSAVQDLGDRGFASDGFEFDNQGRLYLTDYEHNAVHRRTTGGSYETLVTDPRMIWPDSMAVAADGYLYFTCNQLDRQPRFHDGKDLRKYPYVLFRTKIDGTPIGVTR